MAWILPILRPEPRLLYDLRELDPEIAEGESYVYPSVWIDWIKPRLSFRIASFILSGSSQDMSRITLRLTLSAL